MRRSEGGSGDLALMLWISKDVNPSPRVANKKLKMPLGVEEVIGKGNVGMYLHVCMVVLLDGQLGKP